MAGAEDAPSSAESTEELSPTDEQPENPPSVVNRQPRALPSDEELLQKMDEGREPANRQVEKGAGDSDRGSISGQGLVEMEQSGSRGVTGGREGGDEKLGVTKGEWRAAAIIGRAEKGTVENRSGPEGRSAGGQAMHTKATPPPTAEAHSAPIQADLALPVRDRGYGNTPARPAQQPGASRTDRPTAGAKAPALPMQASGSAAREASPPTKPIDTANDATPSENARLAEPSKPALVVPSRSQPAPLQNPVQQLTPASSRTRPEPRAPEKDQQRSHVASQQGPSQATPKQSSARVANSPAPQAPASANSRGSAHQGGREDDVVWLNGKRYQKLKIVGKGGSSRVYKVRGSFVPLHSMV